jgi:hypothetical protein
VLDAHPTLERRRCIGPEDRRWVMGYDYETETNMRFEYRESSKPFVRRAEEKTRRRRKPGKRSSTRPRTRFAGNGITSLEERPRATTRSLLRRQERMESLRRRLVSHKVSRMLSKDLVEWFFASLVVFFFFGKVYGGNDVGQKAFAGV